MIPKIGSFGLGSLVLMGIIFAARADIDITEALRKAGAENYSVALGEGDAVAAAEPDGLVDGNLTDDSGRLLLKVKGSSGTVSRSTLDVYYTITPVDKPATSYRVNSFRIHRIRSGSHNYVGRTAQSFSLEGSIDGKSWHELYRTPERLDWSTDAKKDFVVPPENRFACRRYRFRMYPRSPADETLEDTYALGIQELVLYGEEAACLSWSGQDEEARWDATSASWSGETGADVGWQTGAEACFDREARRDVTVVGAQTAESLRFDDVRAFSLSGDALTLPRQAQIFAGYGDTVNVALHSSATPRGHAGAMPARPSDTKVGEWVLLWEQRQLSELADFTARLKQNNETKVANAYRVVRDPDGKWAEVQFQREGSGGTPPPILCSKVRFEQVGDDIWGRVLYVRYSWANGRQLGDDFDTLVPGSIYANDLNDGVASAKGYAVSNIAATGDGWTAEGTVPSVRVTFPPTIETAAVNPNAWLLQDEVNPKTGRPVVYWKNRKVRDLTAVTSGQLSQSGSFMAATAHCFANDGTTASVQLQANSGGARLCVKVEFTQQGDDILARAVYAKYDWDDTDPHDFDPVVNSGSKIVVYNGETWSVSYSVRNIRGAFGGGDLTLNGALDAGTGLMTTGEGWLTLGMPSVDLDRVAVSAETTLCLKPAAGSQTATVAGNLTFDSLAFDGATTLSLAKDATLSLGGLSLGAAATVTVDGDLTANVLRVGTGKCLTAAERSKIRYQGRSVRQDDDGYLHPAQGAVLLIR